MEMEIKYMVIIFMMEIHAYGP